MSRIRITEVGPRDGLQSMSAAGGAAGLVVPTERKVAFINALSQTGVAEIEVSSFVSPRAVPELADAAEVFAGITRRPGVVYSALVPNVKGLEAAIKADADKIAVFTAASETFCQHNINSTIDESIERFRPVVKEAHAALKTVRGYVSCVVQCPYEGPIDPEAVREIVERLYDVGVDFIDLGETLGVAVPPQIQRLYDAVGMYVEPAETTLHLHDTYGTGLACLLTALEIGVRSFDASVGGLGGCPFAPGAAGNLATEDVVYALTKMGHETGVDLYALVHAGRVIEAAIGKPLPGRAYRALAAREHRKAGA